MVQPALITRRLTSDDLPAFTELTSALFHHPTTPAVLEEEQLAFEAERAIGVFDNNELVASTLAYTRDLTVPGGPTPVAHISGVGVAPTHTRRGIFTQLMRLQLTDLIEDHREPLAALWASEATIYGRCGYGVAAHHLGLTMDRTRVSLDPQAVALVDTSRLTWGPAADEELRADVTVAYERVRTDRLGYSSRNDNWWRVRLFDDPDDRKGARPLTAVVYYGDNGPDGYLLYWAKPGEGRADDRSDAIRVYELEAAHPAAYATLWSFLLGIDLIGEVQWPRAALDEPIFAMVTDPREIGTRRYDNIWLRIVDLPRAMQARSYAQDLDLRLEVSDQFLPSNAGTWRLQAGATGATCERVDGDGDVVIHTRDLASCYLGSATTAAVQATGRVLERSPGAAAALADALRVARQPLSPEIF